VAEVNKIMKLSFFLITVQHKGCSKMSLEFVLFMVFYIRLLVRTYLTAKWGRRKET